jgi:glycosyltransferase involved in cell wall biosynthesis
VLGRVADPEKWAWLSNADLVVMPSRLEPYGLVAMEALALGRRLVVTRVGGLQHIAAPYAIIAEPNPVSLSEAMQTALRGDPQFGRADFSAPSWEVVSQETLKVYTEAIDQRR